MTEQELLEMKKKIKKVDSKAMEMARQRQASLAKPPGSLGILEDISVKMAGITGKVKNTIDKTCVVVMCADNGVVAENVASTPQSVTLAQTINFTRRLTGIGALTESFGSDLLIVDMGINGDVPEGLYTDIPFSDTKKIVNRAIARGTKNLAKEAAMTREQALQAISTGIEMAQSVKENGFDIFGIGEMGIGNTTTSAALLCALTSHTAEEAVGRGSGLTDRDFEKKKRVVEEAAGRCRGKDPLTILAEVGGFDIAAMAGAFIGAALYRLPVVIDGYISAASALLASRLVPGSEQYFFASHQSFEPGYQLAIKELGLEPYLLLKMRLGEGTGCPLAFKIIEGACGVMNRMATFEEAEIKDDYLEEIRKGELFLMNILVSGGCKNGKSMYAQELAGKQAQEQEVPLYYLATMIPADEEDRHRIRRHIQERDGWGFTTLEQGKEILRVLEQEEVDVCGSFLLDSVTALLANEMFHSDGTMDETAPDRVACQLADFARKTGNTTFVSDYIYGDALQYDPWTEDYRKGLAKIDRTLAEVCEQVIEVTYGSCIQYK